MKILLLGATGRTGELILKEALNDGHDVNCLVRNPGKLENNSNVSVFKGSPENLDQLKEAFKGCEAIISALNISRKSDFPWAKLRTPENFLSSVMSNILSLNLSNLKRIVVCSAWGAGETKKDLPGWFRWIIDNSNIGVAYKDHERQEAMLMDSNLSWTIVRPVGLINSKKQQSIIESYQNSPKPKMTISRLSVARYMLNTLDQEELIGKSPVLSA